VRQLADESGDVTLARRYEPYGDALESAGTGTTSYGFAAENFDVVTGLIYLRARFMMPGLGRFLTRDTFPGFYTRPASLNPFTYAENNAVNFTDPSGRFLDTLLDIAFVTYDIYLLGEHWAQGCDLTADWIALGLDVAGLVTPGVTGLGMVSKIDNVYDVARIANHFDNVGDAAHFVGTVQNVEVATTALRVDNVVDSARGSHVVDLFGFRGAGRSGEHFIDTDPLI
jgi:RHS repeat-associated protein